VMEPAPCPSCLCKRITAVALLAVGLALAAGCAAHPADRAGAPPLYLTVTRQANRCVVRHPGPEGVLFSSLDPREAIEWALAHSRIAVLAGGRFRVTDGVRIPRSGVALVIGPDASLEAAENATLTGVTEGHGEYRPLIHVEGKDHVAVLNFGTLRAGPRGTCIMLNGRSGGDLGIDGGLLFSSGVLTDCGDAIWVVDSTNVHIPFAAAAGYRNALLAIEGSEDVRIGVAAGLAGSIARENETIDLNSYCRRIDIEHLIGTSRSEQVLDVNNSTDVTVGEIVGYTGGDSFRDALVSIIHYGPDARRLTQRPRIPESENIRVRAQRIAETPIRDWAIETDVQGLPDALPHLRVTVRLIGNPANAPVTVLARTYRIDLEDAPTVAVEE